MAKFLSTVYSGIRGSVGGLTYTANQFHQLIVRQKTSPVNPNTTRQSQIRSAFSGAVALWAGLSAAFRNAWNDYADTLVFQGPLGPYTVPGRDVFIANISVALYLQSVNGVPAVVDTTPPGIAGFLNISSVAPADFTPAASTGISFSFIQSGAEDVIAYATRSVAFGLSRERFKGPFLSSTNEYLEVVAPGSGVVDFDGLIVDLKYFMRVRFITALAPFRLSAEFIVSSVAVTNV